jgi:hypothetical protein
MLPLLDFVIRKHVVSRSQTIIYSVSIEGGRDDNFIYRKHVGAVENLFRRREYKNALQPHMYHGE